MNKTLQKPIKTTENILEQLKQKHTNQKIITTY